MFGILDRSANEKEYEEVIWNFFSSGLRIQGMMGCIKLLKISTKGSDFSWLRLFHW